MSLLQEEWTSNLVRRDRWLLDVIAPGDVVCDPVDREKTYGLVIGVSYPPSGPKALVLWTTWVREWLTDPNLYVNRL